MLDTKTKEVLNIINEYCNDGGYKVVSFDDIIEKMPVGSELDKDSVIEIMDYLKTREYINIKYFDGEMYCINSLPKGRQYLETMIIEKKQKDKAKNGYLWVTFFGAMIGGFLGSVLVALITTFLL